MIAVAATIVLLGCQKEQAATNKDTTTLSDRQQVESLTEDFLAGIKPGEPNTKAKKWMKVLGTDLKNAVTGAATGFTLGSVLPGVGSGFGAVVGAAVMGGGASLEAAGAAPTGQPAALANPSNPYDYAGETHYDIMEGSFADPAIISADGEIDYYNFHDYAFQVVSDVVPNAMELSTDLSPEYLQQQIASIDMEQTLAAFINSQPSTALSPEEKQLLLPYCNALENCTSAQQFASYSINVENVVVNSGSFSEQQKQRMLIFMATARHGAFYYGL